MGIQPRAWRGVVFSDLHLFARRSRGLACLESLRTELRLADLLVLNGDIFDFRWSALPDQASTRQAALAWLQDLAQLYPRSRIHFILGNHDCLAAFQDDLNTCGRGLSRLHWHEYLWQSGPALFLHGDCTQRHMDPDALRRFRASWQRDRQRGPVAAGLYRWADRLGITQRLHQWHFPRLPTLQRLQHYLDRAQPDWRNDVKDCYFGHTHLPFSHHRYLGITFHNTGSAIAGMDFQPCFFELPSTIDLA